MGPPTTLWELGLMGENEKHIRETLMRKVSPLVKDEHPPSNQIKKGNF